MDNCLEAKDCFILMKKEYRISRNIRAEWYLNRINSYVTISRKTNIDEFDGELEVVSVLPFDPPPEWDSDTAHEYKYLITERTQLHFLSQKYRLVLCLDLSPSLSVVNIEQGKIVFEEIFPTLEKCLKGVVRPFVVPGSQLLFFPKIYITIIAHTPFFKSQPQQVIVQGWLLMSEKENLNGFLRNVHARLIQLQNQLAKLTKEAYCQAESARINHEVKVDNHFASSDEGDYSYPETHPMVSPDVGFVNMLSYGIVALQLLPQNSLAGIIVITDGVISLPDARIFDGLLGQLRNLTISCSFLQIGSIYQLHTGLGYVPFNDLMFFLANATYGVYVTELPEFDESFENEMNFYHRAFLTWRFQKDLEEEYSILASPTGRCAKQLPVASECMRKQQWKSPLRATLNAVLSCRLREGYFIKKVKIVAHQIQLILVLAWKYSISIEYHIRSAWPPAQSEVLTEVWIEAPYEFLIDISSNDMSCGQRFPNRKRMVANCHYLTRKDLRETDFLLVNLQSFPCNPLFYTIPDRVQKGISVFYKNPQSTNPASDFQDQYPQFVNFWRPICVLNIKKWQKWMHTHHIGIILKHETPLPKNLHLTNSSGRYGTIHSRRSELTLTSFLAKWMDFTLMENDSYIKYLYDNESTTPTSFFVVRITSNRAPCLVIQLAFLVGTSCLIRDKFVGELKQKIQQLTVDVRDRSRERKLADNPQKLNQEEREPIVNSVPCCSITHKPIEEIVIRHVLTPSNQLISQAQLCRYLHHRRWIWGLQSPSTLPVNINIMRILDTLTRMRLQEGFQFAYARNGVVTMVKEFEMRLEILHDVGGEKCHINENDATSYCMVQYIMFPPQFANSKDNLEEEGDEMECVEAEGESQVITECWVEPQNGVVKNSSNESATCIGLNYRQLASSFFPLDQECIWGLIAFEYLMQLGQDEKFRNSSEGLPPEDPPREPVLDESGHQKPIQQIPFRFNLTHLLPRCQRAELLLSTLFEDFYGFLVHSLYDEESRANHILYTLILDHLAQLHNGKCFRLSSYDNANLPRILSQRPREPHHGPSPLHNVSLGGIQVPKWTCFLKHFAPKHFRMTLVPSSYDDLKLLLVNRANILERRGNTVLLLDKFDDLSILETPLDHIASKGNSTRYRPPAETYSDAASFSSPPTQKEKGSSLSFPPQQSFTSNSSNVSSRSSSLLQDAFDKSPIQKSPGPTDGFDKTYAQRQIFSDTGKPPEDNVLKRMRYRSGPPVSTQVAYQTEDIQESSESFLGPRRGRAYSLHSNTDSSGQGKRPSRPSLGSYSKEEVAVKQSTKEEQELYATSLDAKEKSDSWGLSEKVRKRNISMPSKCHKEIGNKTIYKKSISVETMKEQSLQGPFSQEEEEIHFTSIGAESPPQKSHTPIYGAATLPIYCFDARLGSIVSQFINKESRDSEVGKDIYMDSTFKMDGELTSLDTRVHTDSNSNTSHEVANKYPSPEPLSEESDTLAPDSVSLRNFMDSIERCHRRGFVIAVFEALSKGLFVHVYDVHAALDQCQEVFLEIDITRYLEIICGHLKDFRMNLYMKHELRPEPIYSLAGTAWKDTPKDHYVKEVLGLAQPFPLSLFSDHEPCPDLLSIHKGIRQKFSDILQSQFSPVPNLSDYYYYSPKCGSYSQAENTKYKSWSLRRKSKKKSDESFAEEQLEGEEQRGEGERRNGPGEGNEEEDVMFGEEDWDKSIVFRHDASSYAHRRYISQTSHISQASGFSWFDGRGLSEENDSESECHPPLFLHLTCTIRCGGNTVTTSINTVPTCLGDISSCLNTPVVDVSKLNVNLEILVMTLLGAAEISDKSGPGTPDARKWNRTISGCSSISFGQRCSESTSISNSGSDDVYVEEEELLNHLPYDQHKAVLITFEKIKWLIKDEIVSSLLHCYPITEEILEQVASHVADSFPSPNCHLETVPLDFVFGMEQSMDNFMKEFKNLKVSGFQLEKVGTFYYLSVPASCLQRRHLFSVVPPLPLSCKTGAMRSRLERDEPDGVKDEADASYSTNTIPDGSSMIPSKVSFEASDGMGKSEDASNADSRKGDEGKRGEKWIRRRERKERRDSEKRGMLERSDSEEEVSNPAFSFQDACSQITDGKGLDLAENEMESEKNVLEEAVEESFASSQPRVKRGSTESYPGDIKDSEQLMDKKNEMQQGRPVELMRCGSINLPHTQGNKPEVIRKSASTDDFSPALQDADALKSSSNSEILRGRPSCDGSKGHQDFNKSRHSSGSMMGLHSDVSSLLESGQNTEDGCEGDISDSDEGSDWLQDFHILEFWIVIKINKEGIQTYSHCRHDGDTERWKAVREEVVRSLRMRVKLVNQRLLLKDLNKRRLCDHLLEPEAPDDIWKQEGVKGDADAESSEYLEAALKFELGAFACPQVWSKRFELHPRLKSTGKGGIKGIHIIKKTLSPFMVTNRKNMFVYDDLSGEGTNVFYLKLHEEQSQCGGGGTHVDRRDESLSRSSSIVSLGKRGAREDDSTSQAESRRFFVEKDVIVEGVPSTSGQRKTQDFIVLTVHGIAEPGNVIKEDLVQMLQKKLDDTVLDAICLMLWHNPHHKLTSEDVHFIQPPYQSPSRVLRFTVNSYAVPYLTAMIYYLRQNMLFCGFTPPKYTDSRPEHHFQDFSATDQDPTTEANIFLFVCPQKSGTKGVACIAFSVVDLAGNAMTTKGFVEANSKGYEDLESESDFDAMAETKQQPLEDCEGDLPMFQFKLWEAGRFDFIEIAKGLEEAIRHALWDLSTEYRFLVTPITPSCVALAGSSQPCTPVKGSSRLFGSPKNSLSHLDRSGSPLSSNQALLRLRHSIADAGGFNRRSSSIDFNIDSSTLIDNVHKCSSRSPSKVRHSVDFGKDHAMPRFDSKSKIENLIGQEGIPDSEQGGSESSNEPLHPVFSQIMLKWLEFGVQMNVPSVKKHTVICPTRSALPVFTTELNRYLSEHVPEASSKFFKKSDDAFLRVDLCKVNQFLKSRHPEEGEMCDFILTNRNERQWWVILYEKDVLEVSNHVVKANKNMKFDSLFIPQPNGQEIIPEHVGSSSHLSSPTSLQTLSLSDPAPVSNSQPLLRFGYSTSPTFIHRQMFFMATLIESELTVYSYNWMKDLNETLHSFLNRLCHWTTARTSLLSSLALQKLGLFHNIPFVRKECDVKEEIFKREPDKKEESNPYLQNLQNIEGLIKSKSLGKDSHGPNERSGRRNQTPPTLQSFAETLRDSAPSKPMHKTPHRSDILLRHGIQMAEINRNTILKSREKKILLSTMQCQAGTTPSFNEVTLSLFKKHARIVHFCMTPLLFLPRWRSEVAAVRDHSLPESGTCCEFINLKGSEPRSRHESGASAKVGSGIGAHLELRRSSSVGATSAVPSPNQNRKRHATLGGEDKWHDALCLSYLKEFIQYQHCFGFLTVCISQAHPNTNGKSNECDRKIEGRREIKIADQNISSPTYLVRQFFGGIILLQINFVEPYFSAMVYVLEGSRIQFRKSKLLSQNNAFIEEVELIRLLLHMHSFTYDYHLRAVSVYVADRQLLFAHGYHLSAFLSDFIKYYHKSPSYARNLIYSGEVRIEDMGTSGEQLYNYVLAREREYQMKVLRMTPVFVDATSERYTEFVLVHTKACRFPFDEECEHRDGDDYDVTLLVSHDMNGVENNAGVLSLKFYVILTSRRDMYPNRSPESKSGRFRTVCTVSAIDQLKNYGSNAVAENSLPGGTPSYIPVTASSSSFSSCSSNSSANFKSQVLITSQPMLNPSKIVSKSPHKCISHESINYLGYFSPNEMFMQRILEQQVCEARERILQIFNTAKIHCRRDSLWQRLMWGFKDEERMKPQREQSSNSLSFLEFNELLNLVNVSSISSLDPQLLPLVSKPIHWYQSLTRLLSVKYQDTTKYGIKLLTSPDGNIQFVVLCSVDCPDDCIVISHNLHTQRADICYVRKQDNALDGKVRNFFQDFINCCCFHLWSGLI